MNSSYALVGALAAIVCTELCAAELSYARVGRENPFSAVVAHHAAPVQEGDSLAPPGYALVGIIGHEDGVDALIQLPEGLVVRIPEGGALERKGLMILQVGNDWVRIELPEGSATLRLAGGAAGELLP